MQKRKKSKWKKIVAVLAIIAPLFFPEVRRFLGLEKHVQPSVSITTGSAKTTGPNSPAVPGNGNTFNYGTPAAPIPQNSKP